MGSRDGLLYDETHERSLHRRYRHHQLGLSLPNPARMYRGRKIIVHEEGSSLWIFTHHRDFAVALVGLLGRPEAIGETYHIISDFWHSRDRIAHILAEAAGLEADIVHVLGDKTLSMIFDNSKIIALVPEFNAKIPFTDGAREIIDWYEQDVSRQVVDPEANSLMDRITADWDR